MKRIADIRIDTQTGKVLEIYKQSTEEEKVRYKWERIEVDEKNLPDLEKVDATYNKDKNTFTTSLKSVVEEGK